MIIIQVVTYLKPCQRLRAEVWVEKLVTFWPREGGGGGRIRISSDRDNRMGAKIITRKTPLGFKQNPQIVPEPKFNPKKSHAEFPSRKHFQKALNDITRKKETLVLNTPKNPYLNQPKKILAQIFPTKKIPK